MSSFDLEQFLPFRLNRAAEWISLGFSSHYRATYKLTRPEWRVLAALGAYGRMTATEVCGNSTMHKTKVSRAVRALEERRWLKRSQDQADRRVEHLELTREGRKSFETISSDALAYQRRIAALLGPDGLTSLDAGLGAIERHFAKG